MKGLVMANISWLNSNMELLIVTMMKKLKQVIIDCYYDEETKTGNTYIWRDIEFYIDSWMPMEEFNNAIQKE